MYVFHWMLVNAGATKYANAKLKIQLPAADRPIPNDFNHVHFGAGQTEAEVTLTPGISTALRALQGDEPLIDPALVDARTRVGSRVGDRVAAGRRGEHQLGLPAGARVDGGRERLEAPHRETGTF